MQREILVHFHVYIWQLLLSKASYKRGTIRDTVAEKVPQYSFQASPDTRLAGT